MCRYNKLGTELFLQQSRTYLSYNKPELSYMSATDDRRLPARIVWKPHTNRYRIQTTEGIVTVLDDLSQYLPAGAIPQIPDNPPIITLRAAARAASRNSTG